MRQKSKTRRDTLIAHIRRGVDDHFIAKPKQEQERDYLIEQRAQTSLAEERRQAATS
jgi:hypothetical protein